MAGVNSGYKKDYYAEPQAKSQNQNQMNWHSMLTATLVPLNIYSLLIFTVTNLFQLSFIVSVP